MYNHINSKKQLERERLIFMLSASLCAETESNFKLQYVLKKILTWNLEVSALLCKMDICGHDLNCIFWKEILHIICLGVMNEFEVVFQCCGFQFTWSRRLEQTALLLGDSCSGGAFIKSVSCWHLSCSPLKNNLSFHTVY